MTQNKKIPRIVVVGGGAGGLELVTRLGDKLGRRGRADITLIERGRTHFWKPHLHELAAVYGAFYAVDSVLVDDPAVKARRLMLCARTTSIMECGLRLLGIEPVERM